MKKVDLNCDMGESWGIYKLGDDSAMLDLVSSANIACGFHAGDPMVIRDTLSLAREKGVAVGAHPGFMDLAGFGRRPIQGENPADIESQILYQIGAVAAMAKALDHPITHVKLHGALSNMAACEAPLAEALAAAIVAFDPSLYLIALAGSEMERAGRAASLRVVSEIYADRAYEDSGQLVSRKKPGAVIHDAAFAAERLLEMIETGKIITVSGKHITTDIQTVCVHGDNPAAVSMAGEIRERLEKACITIAPFAWHDGTRHEEERRDG